MKHRNDEKDRMFEECLRHHHHHHHLRLKCVNPPSFITKNEQEQIQKTVDLFNKDKRDRHSKDVYLSV